MKQQCNNARHGLDVAAATYVDLIEDICTEQNISFHPKYLARDIMSTDIKMVTLDDTVKNCIDFMKLHRVRHAPVIETPNTKEGRSHFIGVISERDLLRQIWPYAGQLHGENTDHKSLRQRMVQIVVRKPKCASLETPIPDVILTMINNKIDMVPVTSDEHLVGIITTIDIIKCLFGIHAEICRLFPEVQEGKQLVDSAFKSLPQTDFILRWLSQTVQEIMTEQVVYLGLDQTLAKAIELLCKKHFRHLPIVDGQQVLIGIVSDRDILWNLPPATKRPIAQPQPFHDDMFEVDPKVMILELPLARIMTWNLTTILPSCSTFEAAKILYNKKVSCLPVVDQAKKLCGIVTVTDLMRSLLKLYNPPG